MGPLASVVSLTLAVLVETAGEVADGDVGHDGGSSGRIENSRRMQCLHEARINGTDGRGRQVDLGRTGGEDRQGSKVSVLTEIRTTRRREKRRGEWRGHCSVGSWARCR